MSANGKLTRREFGLGVAALGAGALASCGRIAWAGEAVVADVDVLVIGGGIMGLSLMHELKARGVRSSFLVTRDVLGAGETLHSHGYMMRGYMIPKEAPVAAVQGLNDAFEWWSKFAKSKGIRYAESNPTYLGAPDETRIEHWKAAGLEYEAITKPSKYFAGGHYEKAGKLFKTNDGVFSAKAIVQKMAEDLTGQIGKGQVTKLTWSRASNEIDAVDVQMGDRTAIFRPRFVIAAAGKDNQPLLRGITDETGAKPFADKLKDRHLVRNLPMILVKGKGLPNATGMFLDAKLSMAAHPVGKNEIMWIVTPLGGHSTTRADVDSMAEPKIETPLVKEGLDRLKQVFPSATRLLDEEAYLSSYFGAKIDHPEGAMKWFVADAGISNLRYVWPGLWSLSRPATVEAITQLEKTPEWQDMIKKKSTLAAATKKLSSKVPVGEEKRLGDDQKWFSPSEFKSSLGI